MGEVPAIGGREGIIRLEWELTFRGTLNERLFSFWYFVFFGGNIFSLYVSTDTNTIHNSTSLCNIGVFDV